MEVPATHERVSRFLTLATFALVVAALHWASEVMIPFALALLLAFMLSPVVIRLTRWGLPSILAVTTTAVLTFALLGALAWVITSQALTLVQELPKYEKTIEQKIATLKSPQAPGALSRSIEMMEKLRAQLQAPTPPPLAPGAKPAEDRPLPVEVHPPRSSPLELAQDIFSPFVAPLGTAALVIVFVIAMLLQRDDLRDRFIKVTSAGKINVATQAVEDAARRVSRYLGMQLIVNATYGVPIGIGLHLIGVPNAMLWGLLAMLLRFIPFLGPWIAALFPIVLALAVDPGWEMALYTIALFIVVEVISNNVVEIWLYGSSTGISNLALMVAAVFWTWLWGIAGLFLSTPLTVCLVVLGKHVPGLRILSELLGSEPVLTPPAQFYQRMVAMDSESMLDMAIKYVEDHSLSEFYDEVFAPALLLSEEDRHAGTLAEVRQRFIFQASRDLIEELERRTEDERGEQWEKLSPEQLASRRPDGEDPAHVLALPARDEADELVALMLRHLLRNRGIAVDAAGVTESPTDQRERMQRAGLRIALVSALPPEAITAARQACRRLKERCRRAEVIVGIWSHEANVSDLGERLRAAGPAGVVTRLADAVLQIERRLGPAAPADAPAMASASPPPPSQLAPPLEWEKIKPEDLLDTIARELAQTFEVPVSLVSIIDLDPAFWKHHLPTATDMVKPLEAGRDSSPGVVIGPENGLLVVEDVPKDRRLADQSFLVERGVGFYAEACLRTNDGRLVGSLCVVDTRPRQVNDHQKALLRLRADELMDALEAHAHA